MTGCSLSRFLPPVLRPSDVQFWDEWKGELTHRQREKADIFLGLDLVVYLGNGKFCCNPIPGYNKTPHVMERKEGGWACTCQGFRMKERLFEQGLSPNPPFCSHLLSLLLAFKEKRFEHG